MTQRSVVCSECFEDPDIKEYVRDADGEPGCEFCGEDDAPTIDLAELGPFMRERLRMFYSFSIDHLMYVSREGGYQGTTWTTAEVLSEQEQLELPRLRDSELLDALAEAIEPDEPWCEYDPAVLDEDESMLTDWDRFRTLVKHERRFFFHRVGASSDVLHDQLAPDELLAEIGKFIDELELIVTKPQGFTLYRARPRGPGERFTRPGELGPPPAAEALQTNRMNPPGIPMFYGAENPHLALAEVRESPASLGTFVAERDFSVLDLANLPPVPGTFSNVSRGEIMALRFLHQFTRLITKPVERKDRTVLEYIPTQVFSEFLRDFKFSAGKLDGVRYPSALTPGDAGTNVGMFAKVGDANVVLFATDADVVDGNPAEEWSESREPWLRLSQVSQHPEDFLDGGLQNE